MFKDSQLNEAYASQGTTTIQVSLTVGPVIPAIAQRDLQEHYRRRSTGEHSTYNVRSAFLLAQEP